MPHLAPLQSFYVYSLMFIRKQCCTNVAFYAKIYFSVHIKIASVGTRPVHYRHCYHCMMMGDLDILHLLLWPDSTQRRLLHIGFLVAYILGTSKKWLHECGRDLVTLWELRRAPSII